jgi:uncharacterized membrane protein/nitrite reductase/ring-hydroxylating ferredoxin subunit
MRSKASFKGHPIHPALIPFPFAFLYGAFFFDLVGRLTQRTAWWTTGGYLAVVGIITALVAAAPGLVDYVYTVPPRSTGKTRATRHMIANLAAVVLFALAGYLRGGVAVDPPPVSLVLEAVGVVLLTAGGWMGGVLVNRNQIGVDPRYASAGKWREASVEVRPGSSAVVAKADELKVNQMKLLRVDGQRIVLGRTEDGYVAFDDHCTHSGGSLAGGAMICGTVQCPWHGSQFDVRTGQVKMGPADEPISTYRVWQDGGEVRLALEGRQSEKR